MKSKYLYILFIAVAAAMSTACVEENLDRTNPASGKSIKFGLSETKTKTIYDSENTSQINWVSGDQIKIFCAEAEEATSAEYTVTPGTTASSGTIAASGSTTLQWGGDSDTHNFYAVYPSSGVSVDENGVATLPINRNQKAIVTSTDGYAQNVVATPVMTNQYMVAFNSTTPTDDPVELSFKPIMTTLDIVITAASGDQNSDDAARVTGVSIASTITTNSSAARDSFFYDIEGGVITAGNATSSGTATTQTENTFVNLVDANGNATYVDMANGKTLTVTVFLPPMSTDVAKQLNRQVKIRVHATGNTELVASVKTNDASSDNWTTQLTPSAKRKIMLPAMPSSGSTVVGNNWITALDGSIYVSQMSIPGAHDAATGEEMGSIIGEAVASTQEETLQSQWDLGVRCFDLRPAIWARANQEWDWGYTYTPELYLYHGVCRVNVSWAKALSTLKSNLTTNPGEFAIVLFRHESENDLEGVDMSWATNKNNDDTDFNRYMSEWVNANTDDIVEWSPDITIDECRGKIILVSRFYGTWEYGCYTGWSHDATGTVTTLKNASGTLSATMYVQDYYNPTDHDAKWAAIKSHLEISRTFHTDDSKINHWMINHASGYVGSSSSDTYAANAAAQNPALIDYISDDSWAGTTGIMLFDYAGSSSNSGDIALQTIIDNNYKYRMRRKGE